MPPGHREVRPLNLTVSTEWPNRTSFDPHQIQAVKGWHCVDETGNWDVEALARDLRKALIHSHSGRRPSERGVPRKWRYAAFEPTRNLFIAVECEAGPDDVLLRVWAASPERARTEFDRLHKRFFRPRAQIGAEEAEFSVISIRMGDPYLRPVRVTPNVRTSAGLVLHYGKEFERWHHDFCNQLKRRTSGVTILQGPPGTGKTTYLRHLLFELKATHRFYYLPLTSYSMLCSPDCIDFWLNENKRKLGKVVVIEDAESLLARRGADNQEALSNLLNIADGFIGDYLRLHVICTINAPIKDLDPAVTRPGRLIASREFSKLTRQQALRLAETLGITLQPQENYSLADIYNKRDLLQANHRATQVGFAA
jgi:ATPase family associated with various cellular activities (AAA)